MVRLTDEELMELLDGTESDRVERKESFGGDVPKSGIVEMLRCGEEKLKAHNRTAVDITSGAAHMITAPYPQTALQQILYNAVLHRTYVRYQCSRSAVLVQ